MLGLICERLAPQLAGVQVRSIDPPAPSPTQVRIRVHAAALNFPDLLMCDGQYQFKPPLPFVLGMEGAGVIDALGAAVTDLRVGAPVVFRCRYGACAEQVCVERDAVLAKPAAMCFEQACAWQVGALTAYVALVRCARLGAGETLLVHGASGGMGLAAVRLGRHLGAEVIATGSSAAKLAVAADNGARHVIELPAPLKERVAELTGGRGADVIFDPVGGDLFDQSVRAIAWGGRLLVVGFAGGRIASVATNHVLLKGISVIGVRAGEFGRRAPQLGRDNDAAILALAEQGVFDPHIGARFALADGVQALRALAARAVAGKLIVVMR